MKLILSPQAQGDLEGIGNWIATDSPGRAVSFIDEPLGRIQTLADRPEAFPLFEPYANQGVRRYVWRSYLAFYVVRGAEVYVFHITHGAQDTNTLLIDG
jgi:toxin ParE1/3/4